MKLMLPFAIALSLVLCTAGSSRAEGPGFGPPGFSQGPGRMLPMLLRHADLSAAQKARVAKIMKSRKGRFEELFGELRSGYEGLGELLFAEREPSRAEVEAAAAKVADARSRLMHEGLGVALEVRKVLTPEQLAKVKEARRRMHALRAEMRELYGPPDGGAWK